MCFVKGFLCGTPLRNRPSSSGAERASDGSDALSLSSGSRQVIITLFFVTEKPLQVLPSRFTFFPVLMRMPSA